MHTTLAQWGILKRLKCFPLHYKRKYPTQQSNIDIFASFKQNEDIKPDVQIHTPESEI